MSRRKRDPVFTHCPRCGQPGLQFDGLHRYSCDACEFVFYQNTAAACGAILTVNDGPDAGRILLLRRGQEPSRGRLDFPGGFIDPGESAEKALTREIYEETGIEVEDLMYFCSAPNEYEYRGVRYSTCDLVFTGYIPARPEAIQESEISGYVLLAPERITIEEIAFPSLQHAMERFLRGSGRRCG